MATAGRKREGEEEVAGVGLGRSSCALSWLVFDRIHPVEHYHQCFLFQPVPDAFQFRPRVTEHLLSSQKQMVMYEEGQGSLYVFLVASLQEKEKEKNKDKNSSYSDLLTKYQ